MRGNETENKILIRRFFDLADTAMCKKHFTHTNFLNLAEQSLFFEQAEAFSGISYTVTGGYPEAERRIIIFSDKEIADPVMEQPLALIKIGRKNVRFSDSPTHRDYLGALLNLGIRREMLGDILPGEDGSGACVFCMETISSYLCENLNMVKHDTVSCQQILQLPEQFACKTLSQTVIAASERLDAILAAVWHLSRGQSCEYFTEGKVFVNGRCTMNNSYKPNPEEIISVRGLGRFQYIGVAGATKKARCRIEIMRYI